MKTTSVAMYAPNQTEPLNFNLGDRVPPSKYIVRSIVGLDAEEIVHRFYGFSRSGVPYYDYKLNPRDIAMRVALRPNFSIGESYSDVRDELYKVISATRNGMITLHFNADATNVAKIDGQIIKFEAALFNKEPEVQITVRCDDPMFRGINPVIMTPDDTTLVTIQYPNFNLSDTLSTAPHGFSAEFVFTGPSSNFRISDSEDIDEFEWEFIAIPFESFIAGDIVHFSSEYGSKRLELQRGGSFLSLIDVIRSGSIWPVVFPGENKFYLGGNQEWNEIRFYPSYWGV